MSSKGRISEIIDVQATQKQIDFLSNGLQGVIDKMEVLIDLTSKVKFDLKGANNAKEVSLAINDLNDKQKQLSDAEKERIKLSNQLEAAQKKLLFLESDSAKQIAIVNEQIKQRRSELNQEAKQMNAAAGSISEMSARLSLLKKDYKELSEEDRKSSIGATMLASISQLDGQIKKAEEEIGEYFRSVGNYERGTAQLKKEMADIAKEMSKVASSSELTGKGVEQLNSDLIKIISSLDDMNLSFREQQRLMTEQLSIMKKNGLEGSQAYQMLREKLGELIDATKDARAEANLFASDTKNLDQLVAVAEGLTGAFSVMQGALALTGVESEELQQTFVKLQAAMAVLNGLTAIKNTLQKDNAAYLLAENILRKAQVGIVWLQTKAESGNVVAKKASTVAQWALNKAMAANPAGLLIVSLLALAAATYGVYKALTAITPEQKAYNEVSKASGENAAEELVQLDSLTRRIEEAKKGRGDLTKVLKEYNSKFGEYGRLTPQAIKDEELLAQQLDKVREAILAKAQAKASEELLIEAYKKQNSLVQELKTNSTGLFQSTLDFLMGGITGYGTLGAKVRRITSDYKDQQKYIDKLNDSLSKSLVTVDKATSGETAIKNAETIAKLRLETMKEGQAKELAALKVNLDEKLKEYEGNAQAILLVEQAYNNQIELVKKKYADQWLKEQQSMTSKLNDAKIALMDEGYQKELAQLEEEDRKKLLELDNYLREQKDKLSASQYAEVEKKTLDLRADYNKDFLNKKAKLEYDESLRILNLKKSDLENELAVMVEGSEQYLAKRLEILEKGRAIELAEAEKTGASVKAINDKYNQESATARLDNAIIGLDEASKKRILSLSKSYNDEYTALNDNYRKGLLSTQEYEEAKSEMERRYSNASLQEAIRVAAAKAEELKKAGKSPVELEQAIADAKKQIYTEDVEAFKEAEDKKKEYQKNITSQLFELSSQLISSVSEIKNAQYEEELSRIDELAEIDEANKEKELEAAGNNVIEKDKIEAKYAAKEKEREKKRRQIQIDQAKFNKQVAILNVMLSTAQAIMQANAAAPFPWNIPLIAIAAAIGAAQLASVISQPIPQYAKGRDGGPDEWAIVGEQGSELVTLRSGESYLTPNKPTLTFLPEGASVTPHKDIVTDPEPYTRMTMTPIPSYASSDDIRSLKAEVIGLYQGFEMLAEVVKGKREWHLNITEKGIQKIAQDGARRQKYLDDNVRL